LTESEMLEKNEEKRKKMLEKKKRRMALEMPKPILTEAALIARKERSYKTALKVREARKRSKEERKKARERELQLPIFNPCASIRFRH
jgi:hypothetical protein